ncbi:MAG: class I adenylate-forming enzyme family protein [Actinomycetota bacterium]
MGPRVNPTDLVAVILPPGPAWPGIVKEVWDAGAALFPIDHRLTPRGTEELIARSRPTLVIDAGGRTRIDGIPVRPDTASLIATSGTGGEPKLVELSRAAVEAAVEGSTRKLRADPGEPWLSCLPLAHIGGLLVVLRSVLTGAPVVIRERFDPAAVSDERDVAYTSVVPTMLARLLEAGIDLTPFQAILVGGAQLPAELRARAERAGARIVETYGLTESCGGVIYDGRPFGGTRVRIGEDEEIELLGPTLMSGYRDDLGTTDAAFMPDGWLRTGDAGSVAADGHLLVDGRLDDLIITGGEKVWPEEVEAALRGHPAVAHVAVAGRADPEWGTRVVAFVVPSDPHSPPTLDEVRTRAAESLPRYKAPRELVLVERLPRTASGKLRRFALGPGP